MNIKTREQVGLLVRKEIANYCEDAWFINNGWCFGFACSLADQLGPDAKVVNSLTQYKDRTFPGHSWVEYHGLHYDAETPDGVTEPCLMQYHIRLRAIADSPDEQDEDEAVIEALGHAPIYSTGRF